MKFRAFHEIQEKEIMNVIRGVNFMKRSLCELPSVAKTLRAGSTQLAGLEVSV